MGMYTTFRFKARLRKDTPENIIDFLKKTIIKGDIGLTIDAQLFHTKDVSRPDFEHDFFDCERWYMLFHSSNWCPEENSGSSMKVRNECWEIEIETEFKNYDSEIDKFIDWISPWILGRKKKQYLGCSRYEEADRQENIYIERS